MFTQNDPSVFTKAQTAKEKLSFERQREQSAKVLTQLEGHSASVVIDAFKHGFEGVKPPVNLLLLSDCVLYIYDQKVEQEVWDFACLSGAPVFNELIPYLTTHIVAQQETPDLRQKLNELHAACNKGATSNKAALTTESVQIELVTMDWLKICLCRQ